MSNEEQSPTALEISLSAEVQELRRQWELAAAGADGHLRVDGEPVELCKMSGFSDPQGKAITYILHESRPDQFEDIWQGLPPASCRRCVEVQVIELGALEAVASFLEHDPGADDLDWLRGYQREEWQGALLAAEEEVDEQRAFDSQVLGFSDLDEDPDDEDIEPEFVDYDDDRRDGLPYSYEQEEGEDFAGW